LSNLVGASIHKPWGENFLWGYEDVRRYLVGQEYDVEPLSIRGFLGLSRVPNLLRPVINAYVDHLPRSLLGTGFNPWMIALVHKKRRVHAHGA
jgi:hypothetical protein